MSHAGSAPRRPRWWTGRTRQSRCRKPSIRPFSPVPTFCTSAGVGSEVKTMSQASATARGLSAQVAPALRCLDAAWRVRSWTTRSWPAFCRLDAMPAPIMPSPMKPIFIVSSLIVSLSVQASVPLQDVQPGIVVGDVHQPVLRHEQVGGVAHLRPPAHRLHPFRRLRRDEVADFLRAVRIGDVEHPHAGALPGGEDRGRGPERSGPVLVQVMRAELATHRDVVLVGRGRHGCD